MLSMLKAATSAYIKKVGLNQYVLSTVTHLFIIVALCNISGNMMKSVRNLLKDRDLMLFTYLVMYLDIALFFNFWMVAKLDPFKTN